MLAVDDKIGPYTLIRFLGKGQFGEVWLGEKETDFSDRPFKHALKFLANNSEEIDLRAARLEINTWVEASGHPNVMPVIDLVIFRDFVVIVSEYADGGSLGTWLAAHGGRAPSVHEAIQMMIPILRGIEYLHSKSVVHRDLKPDNVLLQGETPRITDFGLSRIVSTNASLTSVAGSPAYMSPEAFLGSKVPQTDVWSAGVILYVMLSGRYPFQAKSLFEMRDAIQRNSPEPLPEDVPRALKNIVDRALIKNTNDRYISAREMRLELEKVFSELVRTRTKHGQSQQPHVHRLFSVWLAVPIILTVIGVAMALFIWKNLQLNASEQGSRPPISANAASMTDGNTPGNRDQGVKPIDEEVEQARASGQQLRTARITFDIFIYPEPDDKFPSPVSPIGLITKNSVVHLISTKGNWCLIDLVKQGRPVSDVTTAANNHPVPWGQGTGATRGWAPRRFVVEN